RPTAPISDLHQSAAARLARVSSGSRKSNPPPPRIHIFFFNDPPTTQIYTLSLHDALPISRAGALPRTGCASRRARASPASPCLRDRKSTRLNSSHLVISYAVFCLKKKTLKATKVQAEAPPQGRAKQRKRKLSGEGKPRSIA